MRFPTLWTTVCLVAVLLEASFGLNAKIGMVTYTREHLLSLQPHAKIGGLLSNLTYQMTALG